MCGIVGIVSFSTYGIGFSDRELFQTMLYVGAVRGKDGTGAIIVDDKHADSRTLKIGGTPQALFQAPEWKPFLELNSTYSSGAPQDMVMIGHNRATSVGTSSTKNAHPHKTGHITLVHNGTLKEYSKLPRMQESESDSYALCDAIASLGIDAAIKLAHGSYAIVYYDAKEGTVNFLRNYERPLAFAYDSTMRKLYFASEKNMLRWLVERDYTNPKISYSELVVDTLVSYKIGDEKPEVRPVKGPEIRTYYTPADYYSNMEHDVLLPEIERYYNGSVTPLALPRPKVQSCETTPETVTVLSHRVAQVPKKVRKVLKRVGEVGMPVQLLDEFYGLHVGDEITFQLKDYTDADPTKEKFIASGDSLKFPNTVFKFHVKGGEKLDSLFELPSIEEGIASPTLKGRIKHMLHYPDAAEDEPQYHVWMYSAEPIAANDRHWTTAEVVLH